MKVYLYGGDNIGWSIDSDKMHVEGFLRDLGYILTDNIFTADVVHYIWWEQLLGRRNWFLRFKRKVIGTVTNEIMHNNKRNFLKANKLVSIWVVPNMTQYELLQKDGMSVVYQPFYVDDKIFKRYNEHREYLAALLGIDIEIIQGKFLIGSFQRDTLGADLKTPKWEKNPEYLVQILSLLPNKDKWLLILAGPRRHFIISECKKKGIPYYYCGVPPQDGVDDIQVNTLTLDKMALLYNMIDCYLVTSRSEGGPKAVLEASFSKTLIFSTYVGLAPDILDKHCIYKDLHQIVSLLTLLVKNRNDDWMKKMIINNFNKVNSICAYDVMKERWKKIYEQL